MFKGFKLGCNRFKYSHGIARKILRLPLFFFVEIRS